MSDDIRDTSDSYADPRSWISAALGQVTVSEVPAARIIGGGRAIRARRRAAATAAVAAIAAVALVATVVARHQAPARPAVGSGHHAAIGHPVQVSPSGAYFWKEMLIGRGAALSPDGATLAIGDVDGHVYIFSVNKRKLVKLLPLTGQAGSAQAEVEALCFSPHRGILAVAYGSGRIILWNTATWTRAAVLQHPNPDAAEYDVVFSPNGSTLAAANADGRLYLWSMARPAMVATPAPPHPSPQPGNLYGVHLAFRLDGRAIAVVTGAGLDLWSLNGTVAKYAKRLDKAGGFQVAFSPDGTILAEGVNRGTALWNVTTGARSAFLADPHGGAVDAIAFSRNGQILATGSTFNGTYAWNLATRAITVILRHPGRDGGVRWVGFSPDGRFLVALTFSNYSRIWQLPSR